MPRVLTAALGGALLILLAAAPVHAAPAQADDCDDNYSDTNVITITPTNPVAGDEVTIAGEGFEPGVEVDIVLDTDPSGGSPVVLGTTTTGDFGTPEAGTFETTVTLPSDLADGTYTITAVSQKCSDDQGVATIVLGQVTPPPPAPAPTPTTPTGTTGAGSLARTGTDRALSVAGVAVGLLALGGVFVMTGNRRRLRDRTSGSS